MKRTSAKLKKPAPTAPRCQALQQRMADWPADALLVTNPRDIRYLTGFVGEDSWAVIPATGRTVWVISDFRFAEQIEREAPHVKAIMRKTSLSAELGKLAQQRKWQRIALQAEHVTLAQRKALVKAVGAKRLAEVDDGLLQQRAVKDDQELRHIRQALKIQQQAYRRTLDYIQPGRTEIEIAGYLEYQMRLLGADGVSFPTIVAADANASLPHAIPTKKKLRKNSLVLIDFGARYNGYCSDLTRVAAIGGLSGQMRKVYDIVLEAQMAAIEAIGPGVELRQVDAVARSIIEKAGYGPQFGHSLGHGIGLDIHEQPTLSPRSAGTLQPGHVVTVEPGIYLPGVGGVRIEDDVVVTPSGRRILSSLPKDLASAMI